MSLYFELPAKEALAHVLTILKGLSWTYFVILVVFPYSRSLSKNVIYSKSMTLYNSEFVLIGTKLPGNSVLQIIFWFLR